MKVKNIPEQLRERMDEVYKSRQFLEHQADEYAQKMRNEEGRLFGNKGKARVFKYESIELQKAAAFMYDYYKMLETGFKESASELNTGK